MCEMWKGSFGVLLAQREFGVAGSSQLWLGKWLQLESVDKRWQRDCYPLLRISFYCNFCWRFSVWWVKFQWSEWKTVQALVAGELWDSSDKKLFSWKTIWALHISAMCEINLSYFEIIVLIITELMLILLSIWACHLFPFITGLNIFLHCFLKSFIFSVSRHL